MNKQIQASFTQQQDAKDCGVACLLSIIRYHGGNHTLEKLRELSGTSLAGTTLLGLHQAAQGLGFIANAFEAEGINNLSEVQLPAILHVVIEERLNHYIVLYSISNNKYLIGDPAKGILELSFNELDEIWKSRALLQLVPTEQFELTGVESQRKWNWFKEIIKDDKPVLIITAVLGIIIAALNLSTAIFSQKLIDKILPADDTKKLVLGILLLCVLLLAKTGVSYIRGFFVNRQARDFNNRISGSFYDSLLQLPKSFFDTRRSGEITARLNDTRSIQGAITYLAGTVIIDVLVTLISLGFLFSYSWISGLSMLVCLPVFFLIAKKYHAPIINGQRSVMAAYAHTESQYIDTINGIDTIKGSRKESLFSFITKAVYNLFQKAQYDLGILAVRYNATVELFATLLLVSVIGYSAYAVLHKQILLGEMMAVIGIASGLISSVARLSAANIQLQQARVACDRMFEFAGLEPETTKENDEDKPLLDITTIKVKQLSFRFAGRPQLFSDVSLSLNKGDIVSIQGEVGSGKSMLVQVLQKFYEPESGQITVIANNDHYSWPEIPTNFWRKHVAVVPQQVKIFNGTLLYNICLSAKEDDYQEALNFCREFQFDNYFENLPQSYLTIVGEEGINLSGGQQQLVALARALFQKPQVLFLDEFTSGMDSTTEAFVLNVLTKLKPLMAIAFITHRNQTALLADRIFVLKDGIMEEQNNSILA